MEIIFYNNDRHFTGMLNRQYGYSIQRRMVRGELTFHAERKVGYLRARHSDDRHAQFILMMARLAMGNNTLMLKDIRLTVREFIDAHVSLVTGCPLADFEPLTRKAILTEYVCILRMQLRKLHANSTLNAKDVILLKGFLERRQA